MSTAFRSFVALLLIGPLMIATTGCDDSGSNEPEATTYTTTLTALNSSGVTGTAELTVQGDELTVTIDAAGTTANQVHAQHVHGFTDGSASACPTLADDTDGNGIVSVSEGGPAYGGILVPLDGSLDTAEGLGDLGTFPNGDGQGAYTYRESIATADLALNEGGSFSDLMLENHAIVVHGLTVNGSYEATVPVACGLLSEDM